MKYIFSFLVGILIVSTVLSTSCKKECSANSQGVIRYNTACSRYEIWIEGNGEKYQLEGCPAAFLVDGESVCAKYHLKLDVSSTPTCSGGLIAVIEEIQRR